MMYEVGLLWMTVYRIFLGLSDWGDNRKCVYHGLPATIRREIAFCTVSYNIKGSL